MGGLLTEVVEKELWPCGKHSKRRIVPHSRRGLCGLLCHRAEDAADILATVTEGSELAVKIVDTGCDLTTAVQFVEFKAVVFKPGAIRISVGQLLFELAVVVDTSLR